MIEEVRRGRGRRITRRRICKVEAAGSVQTQKRFAKTCFEDLDPVLQKFDVSGESVSVGHEVLVTPSGSHDPWRICAQRTYTSDHREHNECKRASFRRICLF